MNIRKDSFLGVTLIYFVPCFFLGMLMLYVLDGFLPENLLSQLAMGDLSLDDVAFSALNGLLVVIVIWGLDRLLHHGHPGERRSPRARFFVPVVAFAGGALDALLVLHAVGIMVMTVLVLLILAWNLKVFARRMGRMLHPGNVATWPDVAELLRIYLTMLAGFTLVNCTLEGVHLLAGTPPPFGFYTQGSDFFLNALYFTVVTMTTLGFGDIVPLTWDGKILLIIQCLTSYFMFALMVGIITRGVTNKTHSSP